MRQLLLASVAALGSGVVGSIANAQTPLEAAPTQGQSTWKPSGGSVATVNDNNNLRAAAGPGTFANPTPGTIVVHINGRVNVGFKSIWSSVDERFATAPAAGSAAANLGVNGTGPVKLAPYALYGYARVYFGADAMAANGLRYGAAIELRQNFTGAVTSNTSSNASNLSSLQTVFVRRAFTYVAADQWGILRAGAADGVIGLFDNGVTTFQYLPTGNLQNGSDLASLAPGNAAVPFFFLSGDGNEYAYPKLVYLSPQFGGVDFGLQYAPNAANGFGLSTGNPLNSAITGAGVGTGLSCTVANSGCPTLSSGPGIFDGARIRNQLAVGVRYQGAVSGVGVLAYAAYSYSGHTHYTGSTTASVLGNTVAGSRFTGQYDGLNFGNGGVAATYGGFTIGGNIIGGRINGVLGLAPQNGVSEIAYLIGAKYAIGPFTVGIAAERGDYQGNVNLTGISQRRAQALDVGASYAVAPGYQVYAEYQYQNIQQTGFNFITNSIGSSANNSIRSQGFVIGNIVNF
jgi:predicted porin